MGTIPNQRNSGPNGPNVWSDGTYTYSAVVRLDWSLWAHRYNRTTGVLESFDLGTISGNPMASPMDATAQGDDHFRLTIALDGKNRLHVRGNMHGATGGGGGRYVRCNNVAAFTTAGSWSSALSSITITSDFPSRYSATPYTYGLFSQLGDGTLLLTMNLDRNNSNPTPDTIGREWHLLKLGPNADTWVPVFGDGRVTTANTVQADSDPDRTYMACALATPDDHIHMIGFWRGLDGDTTTDRSPWYASSSDLGATWKTAGGVAVDTWPLTEAYAASVTGLRITTDTDLEGFGYMAFVGDVLHVAFFKADTPSTNHYWWDGATWQKEVLSTANRALVSYNGALWWFKSTRGHVFMAGDAFAKIELGGPIIDGWVPNLDPYFLRRGVISTVIPDGDVPKICSVGNRARSRA